MWLVVEVFPLESISKGGTIDTQSSVLWVYCLEMAALQSECSNLLLIERRLTDCITGSFIVKE